MPVADGFEFEDQLVSPCRAASRGAELEREAGWALPVRERTQIAQVSQQLRPDVVAFPYINPFPGI